MQRIGAPLVNVEIRGEEPIPKSKTRISPRTLLPRIPSKGVQGTRSMKWPRKENVMRKVAAVVFSVVIALWQLPALASVIEDQTVPAARENQDVQAPRENQDVQAPRGNQDVQGPRENQDVQSPRRHQDVHAPREMRDMQAARR